MIKDIFRLTAIAAIILSHPASSAYAATGGFGTTGPTIPFFVTGTTGEVDVGAWTQDALNITGGITATGNAAINGSMTALYYAHISDARMKTDIHPVENALDKLLSMRGVEFKWKKTGREDMGVVAQDVAKVFPKVVHTDIAGMKSVEYDSLVAPMIEAIRELKAENDGLHTEIEEVKAKLDAVKGDNK